MKTFSYKTNSKQVLGDLHTPVSIYLKVRDMYPQSALMESSDFHAGENSMSYIALCPLASIGINNDVVTTICPDNSREEKPLTETFTVEKAIDGFISLFQVTGEHREAYGLYGYTTFNAVKYFEHIPIKESHDEMNDAPDILYILVLQMKTTAEIRAGQAGKQITKLVLFWIIFSQILLISIQYFCNFQIKLRTIIRIVLIL